MGACVSSDYEEEGYEANGLPAITERSSLPSPLPTKKGRIIAFHSSTNWKLHFEASKTTSKLIVVDFTAAWCGPCQYMLPTVNEFAGKYGDVEFIKIDVDELDDVAQEFGVQAMPTFMLIKGGKVVDRLWGPKKMTFRRRLRRTDPDICTLIINALIPHSSLALWPWIYQRYHHPLLIQELSLNTMYDSYVE